MKFTITTLIGIFLFGFGACEMEKNADTDNKETDLPQSTRGIALDEPIVTSKFPYDLKEPEWEIDLPADLREVSGLAYVEENKIALVQDEQGLIFMLDLATKEITDRHRFKKKGDFEGIEVLEETAYVLRSDGDVYEVINYDTETPSVTSHETALSTANDTEGLGYDPLTNLLLISSKESDKLMGVKYKDKQVIVSWDPETKSLRPNPFLVIDFDDIKKFLKGTANSKSEKKFADKFDPNKRSSFKPSAISIHPETNNIYLLASNGNMLLVVDRKHQIIQAKHLPSKRFPQPEGMCFDSQGNLYISNEGGLDSGTLKKFTYNK